MKRIVAMFLSLMLALGCAFGNLGVAFAGGSMEGVYVDENGTTQYGKAATVTYNDGKMSGSGLQNVKNGNYSDAYVSEDAPDMTEQYIQYTWSEPIDVDQVTLYAQYCGAPGKDGQAPTKWTIKVSQNGTLFNEVCQVTQEWEANDEVQYKNTQFALQEDIVAMQIIITEANLDWNHYVVNELEVGQTQAAVNVGVYVDGNGTTQYAKAATVSYNDGKMSGSGLQNVKDGDYTTAYVSEDSPNMSEQYIQLTWAAPIDVNLVTLYAQYCGTSSTEGQAPTNWTVEVSKDGTTFHEVCQVSKEWKANDKVQSANVQFDLQEDVVAMQIVITGANLDWNHYAVGELEVGKTKIGFTPTDITGESSEPPVNVGVYEDGNGTTQYAKAATITYNDGKMSGSGLQNVKDGDYTTAYVSEDSPSMSEQYIQLTWVASIDVNLVTLYAQYCGTSSTEGQAPTNWTVEVSKDGTTFHKVCQVSKEWKANDKVQSANVQFDLQEDVVAMRIKITDANLDWNHYAVTEIEVGKTKLGFVATDITGTEGLQENVGVYKDSNGTTQYAKAATVTYNDAVMSGSGLQNIVDGNYTTTYVSEDNPKMSGQYVQFTWQVPVDVNMVSLYSQYCGTKYQDGQAPTKWTIQVSKDGTNFTDVCNVKKKWRSNQNVQSKVMQFDLQEDILAMRIVITEAKLDWNHYAISEIEIGQTEAGFVATDVTGIEGYKGIGSPQTGDTASPILWMSIMTFALVGMGACIYKRKQYE